MARLDLAKLQLPAFCYGKINSLHSRQRDVPAGAGTGTPITSPLLSVSGHFPDGNLEMSGTICTENLLLLFIRALHVNAEL